MKDRAISKWISKREFRTSQKKIKTGEKMPQRSMTCIHCRSKQTVKRGFRYNTNEKRQLYLCKSCHRKFTPAPRRFRHREQDIRFAVQIYRKGLSLSEVQHELNRKGVKVSRWTIAKWNRRF